MNRSNKGILGGSNGALGGAKKADIERGYFLPKDEDDDETQAYNGFQRLFGGFGDFNPEPDRSIDRDDPKDWGDVSSNDL